MTNITKISLLVVSIVLLLAFCEFYPFEYQKGLKYLFMSIPFVFIYLAFIVAYETEGKIPVGTIHIISVSVALLYTFLGCFMGGVIIYTFLYLIWGYIPKIISFIL